MNYKKLKHGAITVALGALLLGEPVFASASEPVIARASEIVSVTSIKNKTGMAGLVFDKTISYKGRAFYRKFMETWRNNRDGNHHSLALVEKNSARSGRQIVVSLKHQVIYSAMLPGRLTQVKVLAKKAATVVDKRLRQIEIDRVFAVEHDLARDEI